VDPRIIDLYNEELLYLRTEAAEFAREFPDRAARLSISDARVEDPYVERLLEGVAYLSARVRLKIEAQYPNFTQQLLDVLFPGWLAPSPSAAVLRFDIEPADSKRLQEGVAIPRHAHVVGSLRGSAAVRCDFRTARELRLWPLQIAEVQYLAARIDLPAAARVTGHRAASSLRLEIAAVGEGDFGGMPLDTLPLFVAQGDAYGAQLMELLAGRCVALSVGTEPGGRGAQHWLPGSALRQIGFDGDEALYPMPNRGHAGFRVLREYAALPEKFRFVEVGGLRPALPAKGGRRLVLTFYFDGAFPRLESAIKTPSLALFCVPAVNLYERPLERVEIEPGRTEFQHRPSAP
jgi:type VI secretion system protein ImpG